MAVSSSKRRNGFKSKSKNLTKSKKVSSSRKHLNKSRKSGYKSKTMSGGQNDLVTGQIISVTEKYPEKVNIILNGKYKITIGVVSNYTYIELQAVKVINDNYTLVDPSGIYGYSSPINTFLEDYDYEILQQ